MPCQRGFSLVELSVVLVILGLLTGGILGGRSLIHAAELRSIANDLNRFEIAFNNFQLKYDGYPGDLANATQYWGAVGGCPTNSAGTGTQTCDGNGDGILTNVGGDHLERLRSWQHLSNAGLVEGQYAGAHVTTWRYEPGVTVPAGPFADSGYSIVAYGPGVMGFNSGTASNDFVWANDGCRFGLFFGGKAWDAMHSQNVLTPAETWAIDSKLDDGLPDRGKVHTGPRTSSCVTSSAMPSAYALDNEGKVCMVAYCMID